MGSIAQVEGLALGWEGIVDLWQYSGKAENIDTDAGKWVDGQWINEVMGIFGNSFLIASIFSGKQEAKNQLRCESKGEVMK